MLQCEVVSETLSIPSTPAEGQIQSAKVCCSGLRRIVKENNRIRNIKTTNQKTM
jgi:hypothetical protein